MLWHFHYKDHRLILSEQLGCTITVVQKNHDVPPKTIVVQNRLLPVQVPFHYLQYLCPPLEHSYYTNLQCLWSHGTLLRSTTKPSRLTWHSNFAVFRWCFTIKNGQKLRNRPPASSEIVCISLLSMVHFEHRTFQIYWMGSLCVEFWEHKLPNWENMLHENLISRKI